MQAPTKRGSTRLEAIAQPSRPWAGAATVLAVCSPGAPPAAILIPVRNRPSVHAYGAPDYSCQYHCVQSWHVDLGGSTRMAYLAIFPERKIKRAKNESGVEA